MAVFFKRNRGYQIGVLLLLLGLAANIMGLSAPYWTEYHFDGFVILDTGGEGTESYHGGMWHVCQLRQDVGKICRSTASVSEWYIPVKVLQCIGLFGYAVAISYTAVVNCRNKIYAHRRWLEITSGITSLLGLVGVLLYVAEVHEKLIDREQQLARQRGLEGWTLNYHLSWAFYLDLAGCLATIVATVQIGLYNRPVPQPDDVPILSAGSDDMQLAHAQGLASASGLPSIVTDASAYPPPYYVLYPHMYDNHGCSFPKPSDEVGADSSERDGVGVGGRGVGVGGVGGGGGGGEGGEPRLPSYEDAVAELRASQS